MPRLGTNVLVAYASRLADDPALSAFSLLRDFSNRHTLNAFLRDSPSHDPVTRGVL